MKHAILLSCVLLLFGCASSSDQIVHRRILAFGTVIDITVRHHDNNLMLSALDRVEQDFKKMHDIWHPWEPGTLTRTNQLLQTGHWFTASPSLLPLLEKSRALEIQSQHFFNPAIGKLVALWGFHRNDPNTPFEPNMQEINRIKTDIPSMLDIELDGIQMRGLNPDLQFDPGGIAKGFALELVMHTLEQYGLQHCIINAGGDIKVKGSHANRPWKIGIQHPRENAVLASIETLNDESIFTSGDYQRYYQSGNKRRHHIIDPITGRPVAHTMAVTVIHSDAATADAAATALLAAGENNLERVAKSMQLDKILLMNQAGQIIISTAMRKRVVFNGELKLEIKVIKL